MNTNFFKFRYLTVLVVLVVFMAGIGNAAAVTFTAAPKVDVGAGTQVVSNLDITQVDYTFNADPQFVDEIQLTFAGGVTQAKLSTKVAPADYTQWTCAIAGSVATCTPAGGAGSHATTAIVNLTVGAAFDGP